MINCLRPFWLTLFSADYRLADSSRTPVPVNRICGVVTAPGSVVLSTGVVAFRLYGSNAGTFAGGAGMTTFGKLGACGALHADPAPVLAPQPHGHVPAVSSKVIAAGGTAPRTIRLTGLPGTDRSATVAVPGRG